MHGRLSRRLPPPSPTNRRVRAPPPRARDRRGGTSAADSATMEVMSGVMRDGLEGLLDAARAAGPMDRITFRDALAAQGAAAVPALTEWLAGPQARRLRGAGSGEDRARRRRCRCRYEGRRCPGAAGRRTRGAVDRNSVGHRGGTDPAGRSGHAGARAPNRIGRTGPWSVAPAFPAAITGPCAPASSIATSSGPRPAPAACARLGLRGGPGPARDRPHPGQRPGPHRRPAAGRRARRMLTERRHAARRPDPHPDPAPWCPRAVFRVTGADTFAELASIVDFCQ